MKLRFTLQLCSWRYKPSIAVQEKVREGINTKNEREREKCSMDPKRSIMIVQCIAGSQKRMRLAVGFHRTDFIQVIPMKLKKLKLQSSQDLSPGLCFSRGFSMVGLKEQLEAKSSIFVNEGVEL